MKNTMTRTGYCRLSTGSFFLGLVGLLSLSAGSASAAISISVSPSKILACGGQSVTITGSGDAFATNASVKNFPGTCTRMSGTQYVCQTAFRSVSSTKAYAITVTNPKVGRTGSKVVSNTATLTSVGVGSSESACTASTAVSKSFTATVVAGAPKITGISNTDFSGCGGESFVISGTGISASTTFAPNKGLPAAFNCRFGDGSVSCTAPTAADVGATTAPKKYALGLQNIVSGRAKKGNQIMSAVVVRPTDGALCSTLATLRGESGGGGLDCGPHGTPNGQSCDCSAGWQNGGSWCSSPICGTDQFVYNDSCYNNCAANEQFYPSSLTCDCSPGYQRNQYTGCVLEASCNGHGTSVGGQCVCQNTYSGAECNVDLCASYYNTQSNSDGSGCECSPGFYWTQQYAGSFNGSVNSNAIIVNLCSPVPQCGHGSHNGYGGCQCDAGWDKTSGSAPCDFCASGYHQVGPSGGSFTCEQDFMCNDPYATNYFQANTECQYQITCENGGTRNSVNSCACVNGYTGNTCSQAPVCSGSCGVNGTWNTNTCSCDCVTNYSGTNCEIYTPPQGGGGSSCSGSCNGHGTWNATTCACNCSENFSGTNCETYSCVALECGAYGTWNNSTCSCDCMENYSGTHCESYTPPGCVGTCNNGGSWDSNTCACSCQTNYSGPTCEYYNAPPAPQGCQETLYCTNGTWDSANCACSCYPNYTGSTCDMYFGPICYDMNAMNYNQPGYCQY